MRQWLLVVVPAVLLVVLGLTVGIVIGRDTKGTKPASNSSVPVAAIGDQTQGARLWQSKRCGDCHSFGGSGGADAPPLDSMRGELSVRDIASMSGTIWNHAPQMAEHFNEEKIPFPSFGAGEMADLMAYLHGGPPTTP